MKPILFLVFLDISINCISQSQSGGETWANATVITSIPYILHKVVHWVRQTIILLVVQM